MGTNVKSLLSRVTCAVALAWMMAALNTSAPVQAQGDDLPPGEGRDMVVQICTECHGSDTFTGFRRSRAEWESVVGDMTGRRGGATPEEMTAIMKYVVTQFGRVNVNRAAAAELVEIVGVANAEATAIVDYRTKNGEFRSFDDLRKVPGVDVANLESRKDRLVFTGP